MVSKREMDVILEAAACYSNWAKFYPHALQVVKKLRGEGIPKLPGKNFFSLDYKCGFDGKQYTVRQLIAQMKRGSVIGQKFAEVVYQEAQNCNTLEEMTRVGDSEGSARLYGDREIPANVVLGAFGQSSIGKQAFKLMDYITAIYTVTHPKTG